MIQAWMIAGGLIGLAVFNGLEKLRQRKIARERMEREEWWGEKRAFAESLGTIDNVRQIFVDGEYAGRDWVRVVDMLEKRGAGE